jgi:zinc D-Ala-D-Ala carboxypeptidase
MQLSNNFSLAELTVSQTARARGISNQPGPVELEALRALCSAVLQPLRDRLGQGVNVTSGYRGPELNRAVGGVGKSQHLTGEAADIQAPGITVADLFKKIIEFRLPFDQLKAPHAGSTSRTWRRGRTEGRCCTPNSRPGVDRSTPS